MPNDTQDAGERTPRHPIQARIRGQKIIAIDGHNLGTWVDACLVDADSAGEAAVLRAIDAAEPGAVLACWAGSPSASADDRFPDDPSCWSPDAWARLDASLAKVLRLLEAREMTLLVRPHHRHVVGDVPSVGRLMRAFREQGIDRVGILLDVESMLADSMRERNPEDHRRRIREAVSGAARFEIV
jgi:sugar phosphate isomerase/epimerase